MNNYPDKVNYQIVGGLPYEEYIKTFNDSHIFLDQCMSMDQGVNALLALAKGKVVFSGFDDYLCNFYSLQDKPLLDTKPDVEFIYKQLENLIVNPHLLDSYSKKAILFMKRYHNFDYITGKYLKIWTEF
ncbi:glycosyltransferase family 1 protein [Acinetobacter nosocomialis]|nr:glycosyltransferase family 1 protein [Acinetobacter nosocomialis]AZC06906.1 glycosyltransferase family 1 protein [Acinetobacter nosocomialis]